MEDDMVLLAVVDEAEMLIFPSILLPEQHQSTYSALFGTYFCKSKNDAALDFYGHSHSSFRNNIKSLEPVSKPFFTL